MARLRRLTVVAFLIALALAAGMGAQWRAWLTGTAVPAAQAAAVAAPTTQTAPTTTITLKPDADTYVQFSNPSTNFGSQELLTVLADDTDDADILLYFNLGDIPSGSIIERATLTLYQNTAQGEKEWPLAIERITQGWEESTVTYRTLPPTTKTGITLLSPATSDVKVTADLTSLVRLWHYESLRYPNNGLLITGESFSASRSFASVSERNGPMLEIVYSAPPAQVTIPYAPEQGKIDAICDTDSEYRNALRYQYIDHLGAVSTLYLKQDDEFFYACIEGTQGSFTLRYFSLYLDRNNGKEKYASTDDLALQVQVVDSALNAAEGTGESTNTWIPSNYTDWRAVAQPTATAAEPEVAEYQIPLADLSTTCGQPFGLALYHHWVADQGVDYGWPTDTASFSPSTWVEATLARPNCPIRVCFESATDCQAAVGATVHVADSDKTYLVDRSGLVINRNEISDGTAIWAMVPVSVTDTYSLYYTSDISQTVGPDAYGEAPAGEMTLVVSQRNPLMLHNLDISAQWYVESNEQYKATLEANLIRASEHFYDFTNGQMALGKITVRQNYEGWEDADVWLFANNNLRPEAEIGGMVDAPTTDPQWDGTNGKHKLVYDPGRAYMGATWNRFGLPGVPEKADVDTSDDWAAVLAHELGHYFLFLDDTYFRYAADFVIEHVNSCTGSAMGWVYFDENTEFVHEDKHWEANCLNTASNDQLQRDEWATINLWYPWTIVPSADDLGPASLPTGLTEVIFVEPTNAKKALENQLFDLDYRDGETASAEARAVIFRDDRVIDQGKPVTGSTQIELHGAQEGDRLCVIDINDNAITPNTPRNQYGCEEISLGDTTLFLEKDSAWSPIITIEPTTPAQPLGTTLLISVTQEETVDGTLIAQIYPEHQQASKTVTLENKEGTYVGVIDMPFTPAAYVQLFVDEFQAPDGTDPRREAIVDFGVGGGGLPGPTSAFGWAPIVSSSDGRAFFVVPTGLALEAGQFIALQSMAGTPPLPDDATIVDQSYQLIAYPKSLVSAGSINIRFTASLQVGAAALSGADEYVLHYWDGQRWLPLATTITTEAGGNLLASAPSAGAGIYALLGPKIDTTNPMKSIYLPLIQR